MHATPVARRGKQQANEDRQIIGPPLISAARVWRIAVK